MLALTSTPSISDCCVLKATRLSCYGWWLSWFFSNSVIPTLGKFITSAKVRNKEEQFSSSPKELLNHQGNSQKDKDYDHPQLLIPSFPFGQQCQKIWGKIDEQPQALFPTPISINIGKSNRCVLCKNSEACHHPFLTLFLFFFFLLIWIVEGQANFLPEFSSNFDLVSYE